MAFCTNCGAALPENAASCPQCDAVIYQYIQSETPAANEAADYAALPKTPFSDKAVPPQAANTPYYQPPMDMQYAPPAQDYPYQPFAAQQAGYQTPANTMPPQAYGVQGSYVDVIMRLISTAKILGILGLVLGIAVSPLIGWILGSIGKGKANSALQYAQSAMNQSLYAQAQSARKLCKAALIVATVIFVISLCLSITFMVFGILGGGVLDL